MGLAWNPPLTILCMTVYLVAGVSILIRFLCLGHASAGSRIVRPIKFLRLQTFVLMVYLNMAWPELLRVWMH